MKLVVQVQNDLPNFMRREIEVGARAVTEGVKGAAAQLKAGWRVQVVSAGLGQRLAKTIRSEVYPKGQPSPNAAALIWSKAPKLIEAHDAGPLIRSQDGFWLAIPLKAAGKGQRGGKITPGEWEAKTGLRLRFVYHGGRKALLVADDARTNKRGMALRKGGKRRKDGILMGSQTIPVFLLLPQVKLPKRLNLMDVANGAALDLPARIRDAWSRQI